MPIFKLTTQQFCLTLVSLKELLPSQTAHPTRIGSLPQYNMHTGSTHNMYSSQGVLSYRLKSWLRSNEASIIEMLEQSGHSAFAVEMIYALAVSNADHVVLPCNISILGTALTLDEVNAILSACVPYGIKSKLISSSLTELRHAYFVGQRI
ncbi:hypothetical protein [Phyllobacterium phragmitis]|uniref:Uncharacterized protein n=1 Tax=Phyllobacterium phragmitis TaxID=2670329 RepID=A0ABQ0H5R2_9HYPH